MSFGIKFEALSENFLSITSRFLKVRDKRKIAIRRSDLPILEVRKLEFQKQIKTPDGVRLRKACKLKKNLSLSYAI